MSQTATARWATLSKGQAFAIHFALSLLIFSSLVFVMLRWWFPGELFMIDGGWQGLKLVAMVDLVLGPALTLLLYKPGKPKLLLDMSLIALIQIGALAYGFATTWQQRTVAVVYADHQFNTLSNQALREANAELLNRGLQPRRLSSLSNTTPALLYTPPPTRENYGKYLADLFNGFPEPHERSDQFVALKERDERMRKDALDDAALQSRGELQQVRTALDGHGIDRESVELYRFKSRYAKGVAAFDPEAMKIVDYVPIDAASTPAKVTADRSTAK